MFKGEHIPNALIMEICLHGKYSSGQVPMMPTLLLS